MLLLRVGFYLLVLLVSIACGGGGGSSSSSSASPAPGTTTVNGTLGADSGSFPELLQAPANNSSMLSCQTNTAVAASTISGTIFYQRVPITNNGLDYNGIQDLPARGVVVQAVDAPAGTCTSSIVATTLTNGSGEYGLDVPVDQPVCIEVRAQLFRFGGNGGAGWDVQVVDNTNEQAAYYLVDNTPASPADQPVRNLLAGAGVIAGFGDYTQPRAASTFAILDSICEALDLVVNADADAQLPLLKVNWSENNTAADGNAEEGDVGGAFYRRTFYLDGSGNAVATDQDIFLLGDANSNTDEYDPHVINHEFGHFLTSVLSRVDAIGGEHSLGDHLDPRVAFDEGLADAFAAITLDGSNPVVAQGSVYKDSLGNQQQLTFKFAIDRNDYTSAGWYSETSVYSTIYNAYDATDGVYDSLSLGFPPLLNVLASSDYQNSDAMLTLFSFFHVLKEQRSEDLAIDRLLSAESIEPVTDAFGSGETVGNNDVAGSQDVENMYLTLSQGIPLQTCSNNQFGLYNKLSNAQFLRFNPANIERYYFQVDPVSNGRPTIDVYRRGQRIAHAEAAERGDSVSADTVVQGEVVVIVSDYDNATLDSNAPGRYCFDVSVN